MKKIFWAIQNLACVGGTETVSIKLMDLLCSEYEIHLICTSEIKGDVVYDIDPRIQIHSLGIPEEVGRFDQSFFSYCKKFQIGKIFRLIHRTLSAYVFHRGKRRKLIESWMDEDSIYIGSAIDSYLLAPKHKRVFFHFHFDAKSFLSVVNQFSFRHSAHAEKYIFLTKATLDKVVEKKPKLKDKASYVHNPIRFSPKEECDYHDNRILFVGRLTEQKDPMLALEIAKKLHDDKFPFSLQIYGDGHLEPKMRKFVEDNSLSEVTITGNHKVSAEDYLSSDLLLCTSAWEGFYLVSGEANANSCPVVTSSWKGPIEEAFKDGESGWIIRSRDPADYAKKIEEILSNKEALADAKKRAYQDSFRLGEAPIKAKWEEILG